MFRRKVTNEMLCVNCGRDCETFPHIFLECRLAQIMWRMYPIGSVPSFNGNESLLVWFDKLIERWKGDYLMAVG